VVDTSRDLCAKLRPVPVESVHLEDDFWAPRLRTLREVTLPAQYQLLEETSCIFNFRRARARAFTYVVSFPSHNQPSSALSRSSFLENFLSSLPFAFTRLGDPVLLNFAIHVRTLLDLPMLSAILSFLFAATISMISSSSYNVNLASL